MRWHVWLGHWLTHWTGSDYGYPYGKFEPYDLYSGLLGLGVAGVFFAVYRKHNCHVRWCLRISHHEFRDPSSGLTYMLCRRHHPDHPGRKPLTVARLERLHLLKHPGEQHPPEPPAETAPAGPAESPERAS